MSITPLQIFRTGTHTDQSGRTLTFTVSELQATASAYDPALHEAPLVVGHPATDAPAYGWTESLAVNDGVLEATPKQVDPQFSEIVNAGRYKRISSSFWLPDAPGNPVPGVYYLRHIGFLGAAAPAVKGLRSPQFGEDPDHTTTLEFSLEFALPEPAMPEPVQTADFAARETALSRGFADLKAKEEAQAAAFAEADQALKAREAALAKADAERAREKALAFAAQHVQAGRVLPRQQAGLVELLLTLPTAPLEFADGSGTTAKVDARAFLEQFIRDLPTQVDYAEHSAAPPGVDAQPAQFAAPPGYTVDSSGLALHRQAKTLARAKNIPYADAIRQLTGGA